MTAVFSITWQTFRLGLHVSSPGRAAFSTLRTTFGPSKQLKQQLQHSVSLYGCAKKCTVHLRSRCDLNGRPSRPAILEKLGRPSRCVSFWKVRSKEEIPGEMTAKDEVSVTPAEVDKIFGRKMNPEKGVEILVALQKHRHQGTLDYTMPYPGVLITRGLAYLRTVNPFDEDAAIIARIDRETDRMPQTNVEQSPQFVSQFEKLRQKNKELDKLEGAKRKAEENEKEVLEIASHETSEKVQDRRNKQTSLSSDVVQLRPEPEWVRRYRDKTTNHDKVMTMMSVWARLLPSAAVMIAVISLSVLFAQNYMAPSRSARLWPHIPPAAATILTLIGINCMVFLMWRIPPLWKFMNRNFLTIGVYPYSMSMVGASFSHQQFGHLFANMVYLWLIGTRVHDDLGRGPFLAIYFSCAVISAYIPMAVYVLSKIFTATSLGASNAICGLVATACVLYEGRNITLPFLPPEWTRGIDTGVVLGGFVLYELWCMRKYGIVPHVGPLTKSQRPQVDTMGHLTGYITGIGAGAIIRSTDPKWKDLERKHFLTKDFGKQTNQMPPNPLPPE